jgi:hypothetical protein
MRLLLFMVFLLLGCSRENDQALDQPSIVPTQAIVRPTELECVLGIYHIDVTWDHVHMGGPRVWEGEVHMQKIEKGKLYGTMRLRCLNMKWIVDQDVEVTIDGDEMILQGSNVKEVVVPEGRGGYGWDVFKMRRIDKVWSTGDAAGEHEGKGTVKMFRSDFASNQSLKPSPFRVVFQSPGSGQEFADHGCWRP